MLKEKWSKGKHAGCVVSDLANPHGDNDGFDYYGGYLVAESIPKQEYVTVIAETLNMLALLEKALPLIEAEAEQRQNWGERHNAEQHQYATEMRELADEIKAEIDKAYGREGKSDE